MYFSHWEPPRVSASAKYKSVQKLHKNIPDTPVDRTSTWKSFHMLPGHPEAKQSALSLYKSIPRCSFSNSQILEQLRPLCWSVGDFGSSWDLCAGPRRTLGAAETSVQLCGILDAIFSHQLVLGFHNHKAISSIIFIFVTVTRFATS